MLGRNENVTMKRDNMAKIGQGEEFAPTSAFARCVGVICGTGGIADEVRGRYYFPRRN